MTKPKQSYICAECNYIAPKWLGRCPECNQWNTLSLSVEKVSAVTGFTKTCGEKSSFVAQTCTFEKIVSVTQDRLLTGIDEWDRVMGGGITPSSLIVLTGDPGIGKSTLLLAVCQRLQLHHTVLYVSTEESLAQVKQRANRLNVPFGGHIQFCDVAHFDAIIAAAQELKPAVLIIDSIQNCYIQGSLSLPGSIGQLREATFRLMRLAKEEGITIILTGHITKEGLIAGPKTMEHMVDAVFYLQGEDQWQTRVLRSVKNRFGTINELGFFEMTAAGLQEVANVNEHLLHDMTCAPGASLIAIAEGTKPLLIELQALVLPSKMTMPQRVIVGVDHKQVMLIAAILEKYLKIKLSVHDIFFKVSAVLRVRGSGIDLGIACALLSSYLQKPLPEKMLAIGDISLTGHVKPTHNAAMLIKEAERFGIKSLVMSKNQKIASTQCDSKRIGSTYELLSLFQD